MKRAIIAGLVLAMLAPAAAIAQAASFELAPGVVVDRAADSLYLMTPGGGIERVSLSSGNVVWSSEEAAKPLGLHGELLVGQVERADAAELRVVLLDTGSGRAVLAMEVALPEGVFATVDDAIGRRFMARASMVAGQPVVTWQQKSRYSRPIPPRPGEELDSTTGAAYRVDRQASRLVAVDPAAAVPPQPALPGTVSSWRAAAVVAEPPRPAGRLIAATELSGGQTSPLARVTLKRWDGASGVALPDRELFRGPHVLQLRSADGMHLLVTERSDPGDSQEYQWSVFSLESGERVGQLRHHRSHSPFLVADRSVVLIEEPYVHRNGDELVETARRLRAVVLDSGTTVWERPLRDTRFVGEVPP